MTKTIIKLSIVATVIMLVIRLFSYMQFESEITDHHQTNQISPFEIYYLKNSVDKFSGLNTCN